jgi:hypothetical protein
MTNIQFAYKGCSFSDFSADESFSEEVFQEKLAPAFDLDIQLTQIRLVFTKAKGHQFSCHIESTIRGKSLDVVEEGYKPSEVVRNCIKQTLHLLREYKDKHS